MREIRENCPHGNITLRPPLKSQGKICNDGSGVSFQRRAKYNKQNQDLIHQELVDIIFSIIVFERRRHNKHKRDSA
jgi:hypothetical protein